MENRRTLGQRLLDLTKLLLRGLRSLLGRGLEELVITLNLFRDVPTMFIELFLAIIYTLAIVFPSEETMTFIDRIGTGLAVPFILGVFYAVLNFVWVIAHQERDVGWYWALIKISIIPTFDYLIFANRTVHQFIGWGDPASTLRFCIWLVWGVVIANVFAVQVAARAASQPVVKIPYKE